MYLVRDFKKLQVLVVRHHWPPRVLLFGQLDAEQRVLPEQPPPRTRSLSIIAGVPAWFVARVLVHEHAHLAGYREGRSGQCDIIRNLVPNSLGQNIDFSDHCG
jgi:hypothetical protein